MRSPRIVLLLFIVISCGAARPMPADKHRLSQQMDGAVASVLKQRYGLILVGVGGGRDPDNPGKVRKLNYCFDVYRALTLDAARSLIVHAMDDLLAAVNQSEYARQYLSNYPCTANNVWFSIVATNPDGSEPEDPFITSINSWQMLITFGTQIPGQLYGHEREIEETYEQAWKIVREQEGQNDEG